MDDQLLARGLELMLVGMGTVFVFLTTLVGATSLMSSLLTRFGNGAEPASGPDDEEIAAISAAISLHRRK